MFARLRILLRTSPFLRRWVRPFLVWLVIDLLNWKQHLIRKYGVKAVSFIYDAVQAANIKCYADCGTLLGFVREKGFIRHDMDMDFSIMPEESNLLGFYQELEKRGFYFERYIIMDGRLREFSMRYNEISIDFFVRYYSADRNFLHVVADKKDDYWPTFMRPAPRSLIEYEVMGVKVFIPSNYDEILLSMYGEWRTPVEKWEDSMAPKYQKDKTDHIQYLSRNREEFIMHLSDYCGVTTKDITDD